MLQTRNFPIGTALALAALFLSPFFCQPALSQEENAKPKPKAGAVANLRVEQDESTIRVMDGQRTVLVYNKVSPKAPDGVDAIYERSGFIHPVTTPKGSTVTTAFPADHAHQHGIFTAWVNAKYREKPVDFWNLAGRTGRVLHEKVVRVANDRPEFEVDLVHRVMTEPAVDVLRERWKITCQPGAGPYYQFDLETTQQAITEEPLVVEKYHYGGVAVRGPMAWLLEKDSGAKLAGKLEPVEMLNSLGQDRIAGNHAHAHWVAMSGEIDGRMASIIVMDHPRNFRSPQAARLHPTKPYFCFAPCVDGTFAIDRDHPYHARFRFLVMDGPVRAKRIDALWQEWANQ